MKILVLGGGRGGGPMAGDLVREADFDVTLADIDEGRLSDLARRYPGLETACADLSDPETVAALAAQNELVINAVPGPIGFQALEAIIRSDRDCVDIAFYPDDPFDLDELARAHGVTVVVDCGVAPGMSNLLTGHMVERMDTTETAITYVGGLPEQRRWPFEYKAVFSPIDVIAEYTRPARYIENGQTVTRPALSDAELLDLPGMGTLEAFNTDGLRTLATTIDAPNLKEKTLRYPGHIQKMAVLRELGLFDEEPIEVGGVTVRPIDVTARLLFPQWKLEPGEVDLTVMRVLVEGTRDGKRVRHVYDLLDRYDEATDVHSMARTTGYTATVVARLLAAGLYGEKGISPPEFLGRRQDCVDFVLAGLAERGVHYTETVEDL